MRCNKMPIVHVGTRSFKTTMPFRECDFVVDPETGTILEQGYDPNHIVYRAKKLKEMQQT